MPFRRGRGRLTINSRKNVVQEQQSIAANTTDVFDIIHASELMPTLADTDGVVAGAKVNTIFIECWMYGNAVAGVLSSISWGLFKNPGNALTTPNPNTIGNNDLKKFYFMLGRGLVGNQANGQPGYLIKGWFSIPKVYRKQGFDDVISLVIRNDSANPLDVCKLCVYKWYY